jgi:hypothetical protein
VVTAGRSRSHRQARKDARAMHLLSPLMRTLLVLGLLVAPVATVAAMLRRVRHSGTDGLGMVRLRSRPDAAGEQRRSFRLPLMSHARILVVQAGPPALRKSECFLVESLMWLPGSQANSGMRV